jgi:hypothetical protein
MKLRVSGLGFVHHHAATSSVRCRAEAGNAVLAAIDLIDVPTIWERAQFVDEYSAPSAPTSLTMASSHRAANGSARFSFDPSLRSVETDQPCNKQIS